MHKLGDGFLWNWSHDNKHLIYGVVDPRTKGDIWAVSLAEKKAIAYVKTDANEAQPRLSPNGKWLAYLSDKTGRFEVYVDSFTGVGADVSSAGRGTWPISMGGATRPVWSGDGRELFGDRQLARSREEVKGGRYAARSRARRSFRRLNHVKVRQAPPNHFL